jgi:hypothetical protein
MTIAPVRAAARALPALMLVGALASATTAAAAPTALTAGGAVANRSVNAAASPLTTAANSAGYAVQRVRLPDGRTVVVRLDPCQSAVTYKVNVAAVPARTRAAVLAEIRTAVARLAAATGIAYRYRGTTAEVPRSATIDRQSAELVVAVSTSRGTDVGIGGATVGMGGYHYWIWQNTSAGGRTVAGAAIGRSWVVFDRDGLARLRAGFGAGTTRGNVMLHELGHSAGLEHVDDRRQLMNPILTAAAPNGLAAGDKAGLAAIGRRAGCIALPAGMVTDLS